MFSAGISLVVLATLAFCSGQVVPDKRISLSIGDLQYFSDQSETRTREAALSYCNDEGGELAKVWNDGLFRTFRTALRQVGAYWIDGIDRPDESRFQLNSTCSFRGEILNFRNMAGSIVEIQSISCLSLQRASPAINSKIVGTNCNEPKFVLCQRPLSGCQEEEVTTAVPGYGGGGLVIVQPN